MAVKLSVNLNKIALLRNSRGHGYPDVVAFGRLALEAGAHGVTVHPRPDQRHARLDDLAPLRRLVEAFPGAELNVEGYPTPQLLERVWQVRPHQLTLVPDDPGQLTSDHGWDPARYADVLRPVLDRARELGIRTSLFMDPQPLSSIDAAAQVGADRIELHTETYARAWERGEPETVLPEFTLAAERAQAAGLGVNAGHDLDLINLGPLLATVPDVLEVSIGHALTVEALQSGWQEVVRRYLAIVSR